MSRGPAAYKQIGRVERGTDSFCNYSARRANARLLTRAALSRAATVRQRELARHASSWCAWFELNSYLVLIHLQRGVSEVTGTRN